MPRRTTVLLSILILLLVACQQQVEVPVASVPSTPVNDLPVSADARLGERIVPTAVAQSILQEADAEYMLLTNLYERISPSVVNIEADVQKADGGTTVNRGSGFVYDMIGHIITSAHIVNEALTVRVTFDDGYLTTAQIVGVDTYSDLAVVKVITRTDRLRPVQLIADSNQVRVGQRAVTIGNPFGLSSSMSAGIVSGVGRTLLSAQLIDANAIPGFQNPSIIQTDAPINPGNSGGPLLNSQGQVIGVNTAIRSDSGIFQGVGFAVPSNTVLRVVPSLIQNGDVDYAWLGIYVTPEDNGFGVAGMAEDLNLPVESGVLVRGLTVGSPADVAGLRGGTRIVDVRGQAICAGGDIILAINGTYVDNLHELTTYLMVNTRPGDTITALVVRNSATFEVPITLQSRPTGTSETRDCEG